MKRPHLLLGIAVALTWSTPATRSQDSAAPGTVPRSVLEGTGLRVDRWARTPHRTVDATAPAFDIGSSVLRRGELPPEWHGASWFHHDLDLRDGADAVWCLRHLRHLGASEIEIDGTRVGQIGTPGGSPAQFRPRQQLEPLLLPRLAAGVHRLSIHLSNPLAENFHRVGYPAGFSLRIEPCGTAIARARTSQVERAGRRAFFPTLFLAFALLHGLLFAFRRREASNAWFALFSASLAALAFLLVHKELVADPRIVFWSETAMNLAGLLFAWSGPQFARTAFGRTVHRPTRAATVTQRTLLLVLAGIGLWSVARPAQAVQWVFLAMFLGLLDMARRVLSSARAGRAGARIVAAGVLVLAVGFGGGLLATAGVLSGSSTWTFWAPFVSVLVLLLTMSIHLSRHYATTHRRLEQQLVEVERLSAEKLEQERRAQREELERSLLEAELERREEELEEARRLQLSMLPAQLPQIRGVDLAAHMTTATEVGGDYYDFEVSATDGEETELTFVVGDATGHGMRAGTMVTATKSLFQALGGDDDLVGIVSRSNRAIKQMRLRNLNMALLLGRLSGTTLRMVAAGMPQPLIWRAASQKVEPIEIGGMPLGALARFPYVCIEVELEPGDRVLFVSDGLPERLNPSQEQLGYEAVSEAFASAAATTDTADELIAALVACGEHWADGEPLDDDLTLVVLCLRRDEETGRWPAGETPTP